MVRTKIIELVKIFKKWRGSQFKKKMLTNLLGGKILRIEVGPFEFNVGALSEGNTVAQTQ